MRQIVTNYQFNAAAQTLSLPDFPTISLPQFLMVTDVTQNQVIYNFSDPNYGGTVIGGVLHFTYDTSGLGNSDMLQIFLEAPDAKVITAGGVPDDDDNALNVTGSPQTVDRISFAKAIANGVDPDWGTIIGPVGSGQTVNQTSGNLVLTAGTTANAETVLRSLASYKGGVRMRAQVLLSQRIANNAFYVELMDITGDALACTINSSTSVTVTIPNNTLTSVNVGQSMFLFNYAGTGTFVSGRYVIASVSGNNVTFTVSGFAAGSGTCSLGGRNYYHVLYDGTTATSCKFDTQRGGYATGDSTATISTTASPGHIIEVIGNDMKSSFLDTVAAITTSTFSYSQRAARVANVPDDSELYFQIRVVNGATAPASNTTMTVGFTSVENFSPMPISVSEARLGSTVSLPVVIQGYVDTELPSAATLADAASNPSTPQIAADGMLFNGTTWDRARNNHYVNIDTSAAHTSTFNGATATNFNGRGVMVYINVTAASGTPSMLAKLQYSFDGTNFFDADTTNLQSTAITGIGAYVMMVYPGIATAANKALNGILPRTWRMGYTISGSSPSLTFATWAAYLV